jgi:hypothetical protein
MRDDSKRDDLKRDGLERFQAEAVYTARWVYTGEDDSHRSFTERDHLDSVRGRWWVRGVKVDV